jgi:hypothetical protein
VDEQPLDFGATGPTVDFVIEQRLQRDAAQHADDDRR